MLNIFLKQTVNESADFWNGAKWFWPARDPLAESHTRES